MSKWNQEHPYQTLSEEQKVNKRQRCSVWAKQNRSKLRENARKNDKRLKKELFKILTPIGQIAQCAICGGTDERLFQIHHVNGDGHEDRLRFSGKNGKSYDGMRLVRYYIAHPEEARQNLQIVCYPCHVDKHVEIIRMRNRRKEAQRSYGEVL